MAKFATRNKTDYKLAIKNSDFNGYWLYLKKQGFYRAEYLQKEYQIPNGPNHPIAEYTYLDSRFIFRHKRPKPEEKVVFEITRHKFKLTITYDGKVCVKKQAKCWSQLAPAFLYYFNDDNGKISLRTFGNLELKNAMQI